MTANPAGPTVHDDGPVPPPAPARAAGEPPDALDLDGLRRTVAEVLGVAPEHIGDDADLLALGVDSVKVMTISARLRRYRLRVGFARMIEEPTLRAWWRLAGESAPGGRHRASPAQSRPAPDGGRRPE